MKVVLDLNILLDVIQKREPFYASSASVLQLAVEEQILAIVPTHLLTTLYYITAKYSSKNQADLLVDWILSNMSLGMETKDIFLRARGLQLPDFEDAVVAGVAEAERCQYIMTRNVKDFRDSPVQALTPEEFLVYFSFS